MFKLPKKLLPVIMVLPLLAACSGDPKPPPPITFNVTADYQANNGRLFYFVVRNANQKQFMIESYTDVASKAFSDPPDPGVLGVFSVVPGSKQDYAVTPTTQGAIALYFLFTQPGLQWKKLLSMPIEPDYDLIIKANSQVDINRHKSWYCLFWC
jgi:hypothetical protein